VAHYAIISTIDQTKLDVFARLRAEHYGFLVAQQHRILFGGPARKSEGGPPQVMIIIVEARALDDAQAFIADEPYNRNGGFSEVNIHPWSQVLPETKSGELARTYEAELQKATT
jgi:uncharacterized protein YciI